MSSKIKNLVVNGCSYMEIYASGYGHIDLARFLDIPNSESLAIGGSANSRILRTTLKHSYTVTEPTLYVLGLTFISRGEIPILSVTADDNSFEGRWVNPQNQTFEDRWEHFWSKAKSEEYVKLKIMVEAYSLIDRTEDLMYSVLAAIHSLQSRGHQVLIYQQADESYYHLLKHPKLQLFSSTKSIINGFGWCAVIYQHEQGVEKAQPTNKTFIGPSGVPDNIRHPAEFHHRVLNEYLIEYINNNKLLDI